MRRGAAVLALCSTLLIAAPAAAQTGWARFDSNTYVQWHTVLEAPPAPENLTPGYLAQLHWYLVQRAAAVQQARQAHVKWLRVQEARRAEIERLRALQAQQQAIAQRPAPAHAPAAPPQHDPGGGSLRSMVCSFAWSCSIATCIVGRESGWNPRAVNPRSGSAGLFQLMPFHWRGKFDPFNPYLNARYAYGLYRQAGWSPWNGGQYGCGF